MDQQLVQLYYPLSKGLWDLCLAWSSPRGVRGLLRGWGARPPSVCPRGLTPGIAPEGLGFSARGFVTFPYYGPVCRGYQQIWPALEPVLFWQGDTMTIHHDQSPSEWQGSNR